MHKDSLMMNHISQLFDFNQGITQVLYEKSTDATLKSLPAYAELFPAQDTQVEVQNIYSQPPPTLSTRTLQALKPDLGDERYILLPDQWRKISQDMHTLFQEPSAAMRSQLKGSEDDEWLLESLQALFEEMNKDQELLDDNLNALKLA